jgi:Cys-tRNA(Pro)/Cys-tRNA(Cys) deacylase
LTRATPATTALDRLGIVYELVSYDYDPGAARVGMQAAESLGVPPDRVLKTLMVEVDGKPVCALLASDRELVMKRVAAAAGGKAAAMMKPADAERLTGYRVGGVSAFGQKRKVRTLVDASALGHESVFVNGGQRGLQAKLSPGDLVSALQATVAEISA